MPRSYRHIKEYEREILELKVKEKHWEKLEQCMDSQTNKYIISLVDII